MPTSGSKHFWYQLRDEEGIPREGEQVYIYESVIHGRQAPYAPSAYPYPIENELYVFDEDGNPLTQPLTTSTATSSAASAAASAGSFEFYVRDAMSPSGYSWADRIRIQWDHEGTDKYADRIMLWGDFYESDETDTDTDINKAINNIIACRINTHINLVAGDNLTSSSSSSVSSSSSSSSSS